MSDYKVPELPSDDELGITDDDKEKYGKESEPELSPDERAALLGESGKAPEPPAGAPPPAKPKGKGKATRKEPGAPAEPRERPPRRLDAAPPTRWKGPVTFVLLAAVGFLSSSYRAVPSPVPANAPDTAFSSARAMSSLVEIARQAHPVGSTEHARVREYLVSRLRELGLDPSVETATSLIRLRSGVIRGATVRNILARIPGTASTGAVLIDAHYDGAGLSHAAADDGAGVVAVLEAVRALKAGPPLKNDVIVLLSDAEELGLMGARAFVHQDPWMSDVKVVINLEMRGAGGPSIMFQTGADDGWIVRQLAAGDPDAFANSLSPLVYEKLPNDTDFSIFKEAGRQGLNFAAIARAHVYHEAFDTPENLSEGTLQHEGVNALSMLRQLGNADLATVNAPNVVYVSVPVLGLLVYSTSWIIPITVVILLLTALSFLIVLRKGGTLGGIGVGLAVAVVATLLAGGAGYGLVRWLPRFHPELGGLVGSAYHSEGWYVLALLGAALFLVTTLFSVARRKLSLSELALGAVLLPVIAATVMTFLAPAGAVDVQWPALAAVLGVLVATLLPGDRPGIVTWIVLLVLAVPASVVLVPLTELTWMAGSIRIAMYLGMMMVTALLVVLPLLDALREPNAWWAPVTALVLGGACLAVGVLQAKPSATRPEPSTLLYAMDRGTGQAWWATDTTRSGARVDSTPDPARGWARQHAGLSGAFGAPRSFDAFLAGPLSLDTAPAQPVQAPLPQVAVLSDSTVDGIRHVRLGARSLAGAEMMLFKLPPPLEARLVGVNGQPLPPASTPATTTPGATPPPPAPAPSQLEYWGIPDTLVELDFRVNPVDTALDMALVERIYQPTALLGADAFSRPADLTPDVRLPTDQALLRTPLRVNLATGSISVVAAPAAPPTAPQGVAPSQADSATARDTTSARRDTVPPGVTPPRGDSATARDTTSARRDIVPPTRPKGAPAAGGPPPGPAVPLATARDGGPPPPR
ncbi:MAG: M28 family peptidase [Gemmatimonadetes bacterium]|nr:M28 family peptidase [Gemmatimonadota bacterium]